MPTSPLYSGTQIFSCSNFLYRALCCLTLLPLLPALALPVAVFQKTEGVLLLIPALAIMLVCIALQGKLANYLNTVPVPNDVFCKLELAITQVTCKAILIFLMFFLGAMFTFHPSFFAKAMIAVAMILCPKLNPTLQKLPQNIIGKKVA